MGAVVLLDDQSTRVPLREDHIFGREVGCATRLRPDRVLSQIHATVRWTGHGWSLRDMSANGTSINGRRVVFNVWNPLRRGDVVTFVHEEHGFRLEDEGPPVPMAVRNTPSGPVTVEGEPGLLVLGDGEITIVEEARPVWWMETSDASRRLETGSLVELSDGTQWQVHVPVEQLTYTHVLQTPARFLLFDSTPILRARGDAYHLVVRHGGGEVDFGERACFELLYELAGRRERDRARSVKPDEAGWCPVGKVAERLHRSRQNIALWKHQCGRFLVEAGFADGRQIFESRSGNTELRFGLSRFLLDPR